MKLLLDMGISRTVADGLAALGHDVVHVRALDPRAEDRWIAAHARGEDRVVVTADLDFGDIVAHSEDGRPSVVLLRLRDSAPPRVLSELALALENHDAGLASGAVVLVEEGRCRVRRLPLGA